MTTFQIIAFPHGARTVVGTIHGRPEAAVEAAAATAFSRDEFVDVERDGRSSPPWAPDGPV